MKDSLREKDFMLKLDLKDVYFSIPLHQNSKKYVTFTWDNSQGIDPTPFVKPRIYDKPRFRNLFCEYYVYYRLEYLRVIIDSNLTTFPIPEEKVQTIKEKRSV